jgi:hypothetical protein
MTPLFQRRSVILPILLLSNDIVLPLIWLLAALAVLIPAGLSVFDLLREAGRFLDAPIGFKPSEAPRLANDRAVLAVALAGALRLLAG